MNSYVNIAGHGGKDPGSNSHGFKEKDWTLDISERIHELLKKQGILTKRLRDKDVYMSYDQRSNAVKNSGADYCLDLHINSSGKPNQGFGAEIIISIHNDGKLANLILTELGKLEIGIRKVFSKKNSKGKDWYHMQRMTGNVRTLTIEFGFINTDKDRNFLKVADNRQKCAEAVVKAICKFEGITYKEEIKNVSKEELTIDSEYKIRNGDTLSAVARKFNTTVEAIADLNRISNVNIIQIGDTIKIPQSSIKTPSKPIDNLKVDGDWGPATTRELQKHFGTTVDGKISTPKSLLIIAIQKHLNLPQTGRLDPPTIRGMQKHFGTPVDSKISKPSLMVKEMQRRLNQGKF